MLIPDDVRKCVAFVAWKTNPDREPKLGGTAFFVGIPVDDERWACYAVTSRHALEKIKDSSCDHKVYLRVNLKNHGAQFVPTELSGWQFHPTEDNADVGVHAFSLSSPHLDHRFYPIKDNSVATVDVIKDEKIGIGDEVFLTGLFKEHTGKHRNIPILRVGNIAAMPEEQVATKRMGLIDAYLIECRSIGGLSGSPVFVCVDQLSRGKLARGTQFHLLGLMHGHWDLEDFNTDDVLEDVIDRQSVNMGIAIVVPADKMLDTLNCETFRHQRQMLAAQSILENNLPIEDIVVHVPPELFTVEDVRTDAPAVVSDDPVTDTTRRHPKTQ